MQPTKEFLEHEYLLLKTPIRDIANKLGYISTTGVHYWLNKYNISHRNSKLNRIVTKEYLEEHYLELKKSAKVIAKELGIKSSTVIFTYLKKFNIPRRKSNHKGCKRVNRRIGYQEITGSYWYSVKHAAKVRNLEFNISIEDVWNLFIKQNKLCALSGLPIYFAFYNEDQNTQTTSLDRIDSTKGYVLNNVQWVHKDINRMKHNFNEDYFINMCISIARYKENKSL
jgi:hypothetical protein